jgi:multidrug efflux pump subunit AcrA (membrane-fusion protein)
VRRAPLALAALAVATLSLTAAACEPSTDGIATGTVNRATVVEVVDVPASVTARAVATVSAPADGTLVSLSVQPGATVTQDQIIGTVDSPTAMKRLADAQAALTAASQVGGRFGYVDLSGVQNGLDAAARDAFAAARDAAGSIADDKLRGALLAQVDAAEAHYESAAAVSRRCSARSSRGWPGSPTRWRRWARPSRRRPRPPSTWPSPQWTR